MARETALSDKVEHPMTRITKSFATLAQAEAYQQSLYNRFDHVQLVNFPRFSEEGQYTWEVK